MTEQVIGISPNMAYVPAQNQSVSGTVGASVIGLTPVNVTNNPTFLQLAGSVLATSATVNTGNSSVQVLNFPANQSVSGAVSISNLPANQSVSGTVAVTQVSNPWLTRNSIAGIIDAANSTSTLLAANSSFTGAIVDALSFSQITTTSYSDAPSGTNGLQFKWSSDGVNFDHVHQDTVLGSVLGFLGCGVHNRYYQIVYVNGTAAQGVFRLQTVQSPINKPNEFISVDYPLSATDHAQVFKGVMTGKTTAGGGGYVDVKVDPSGALVTTASSVVAFQGTSPWVIGNSSVQVLNFPTNQNVSGSVVATISGTPNVNTAGSVVAFQGTNPWLSSVWLATPGTPIRYTGSVVSTSVTLIQASAAGKKSYVTDFWAANTGATTTLLTFKDGSTSVLGYTIAPTGGGSNSPGILTPMVTATAQDLVFQATTGTSILYLTVNGYQI